MTASYPKNINIFFKEVIKVPTEASGKFTLNRNTKVISEHMKRHSQQKQDIL